MDQIKRSKLIELVREQPNSEDGPLPVVSVEQFFDGNDDAESIGCNLLAPPGIRVFRETLEAVQGRLSVQRVLVEVPNVEEAVEHGTMWPFSDRVYVLTRSDPADVATWLSSLAPDEVVEGWYQGQPSAAPCLDSGVKVLSVWWD